MQTLKDPVSSILEKSLVQLKDGEKQLGKFTRNEAACSSIANNSDHHPFLMFGRVFQNIYLNLGLHIYIHNNNPFNELKIT